MSVIVIQCILGYENFEMLWDSSFIQISRALTPLEGRIFFFSRINKLSIISFSQGTGKK